MKWEIPMPSKAGIDYGATKNIVRTTTGALTCSSSSEAAKCQDDGIYASAGRIWTVIDPQLLLYS
jgi:hypothetical protein